MSRSWSPYAWLAMLLLALGNHAAARECLSFAADKPALEVFFPPWDNAQQRLLQALDEACEQVLVQAFVLTSEEVAAHLLAAYQRGIDVRVLADARQHADTPSSLLHRLSQAGIPVWLEQRYRHAHNKVMVIDARLPGSVVVTGSYNFTWAAQHRNAENLLIIRGDPLLAGRYAANWQRHQADAVRLSLLP